eukprot:CAMPEP_0180685968 /NCGR_PEP_ID=MMETSP1037_2-20121125/72692_1 /TAXON_ID=632150 /ORGANISM="Azadinium spinosum, Strain 3D9" /LENGTH=44 /DNA_ID= /DNA_START= /DNA_END= /DNA_ORIENTATION=
MKPRMFRSMVRIREAETFEDEEDDDSMDAEIDLTESGILSDGTD